MKPESVTVVADAHLGHSPGHPDEIAFHDFLRSLPGRTEHLVINGDLFEFWFEYRSVIPREAFRTLAILAGLRHAGVRLTVTGGNHDRWGADFWRDQLDATFAPDGTEVTLAGFRGLVRHGDGLTEQHRGGSIMHRITRFPLTAATFRWIHPDVGFWLVKRMSRMLGESTRQDEVIAAAATAQSEYARRLLTDRTDLDLVVLAHTHVRALVEVAPSRWFLNPGSWMGHRHYAVITERGPELKEWDGA